MSSKKTDSGGGKRRPPRKRRWLWRVITLIIVWFLTGFPFSFWHRQYIQVHAEVAAGYGRQAISWHEQLIPEITEDLLAWAKDHNISPGTMAGAVKAAALERNGAGVPTPGTGQRISMFDILAISSIESSIAGDTVDPTVSNITGHCVAWVEIMKRLDLGILAQLAALKRTTDALTLSWTKVYGSCGAGAIGFTQALPTNWWRLMGPGFNPWSREDAAEFTARYLSHHYFTSGRRAAIHSYNPNALDSKYTDPIIKRADALAASFAETGLQAPTVLAGEESLETSLTIQGSLEHSLTRFPASCPPGWAFGSKTWYGPHQGLDFRCPTDTAVHAAAAGVVVITEYVGNEALDTGYGRTVVLYHGTTDQDEPIFTLYAHNHEYEVKPGQWVGEGKIIARSDNTGTSTGPHIHFEVRKGGSVDKWRSSTPVDPKKWIGEGEILTIDVPEDESAANIEFISPRDVRLELVETPAVLLALDLGRAYQTLERGVGIYDKIQEVVDKIPIPIPQLEAAKVIFEWLKSKLVYLENFHRTISRLAIAGQPRELGLDPNLSWRLFPLEEGKEK